VAVIDLLSLNHRPDHDSRPIIRSLICHLETHGLYSSIFESYYLRITSEFYVAESTQKAETVNAQEFLKHCALRGTEEDARSRHVLPKSSWGLVKKATESSLLDERLTWLAKEGMGLFVKPPRNNSNSIYHDYSNGRSDEREEDYWVDQDVWSIFP